MPMESRVKFWSPQNTARVSREGGVAVISHIIEAYGGQEHPEVHNETTKYLQTAHP